MNFDEAMKKIDSLLVFGICPGLSRIKKLLELMGNPQDKLRYVHIAGTNGKGSVSNMTASVLMKAGYKTGLFTSPHITGFGERMRINFHEISEDEVARQVSELFPYVEKLKAEGITITEFEFVTAIAFNWFARQRCDVVVLEVGLGGRYDATNVIDTPLCSVITSISLDHTGVLGDTYEKIAMQKCGIIKENGCTVFLSQSDEVDRVIINTAGSLNNTVFNPPQADLLSTDLSGSLIKFDGLEIKLPLLGQHQLRNVRLVLAAVAAMRSKGLKIGVDAVKNGIEAVKIPARFEVVNDSPLVIIDGAHNPGGLKALAEAVDIYLSDKKIICVMGMLKDKDCKSSLRFLDGKIHRLITTTVKDNPRRQSATELMQTAQEYFSDISAEEDCIKAIETAVKLARSGEDTAVLVCGSLYLAADIRAYLDSMGMVKQNN